MASLTKMEDAFKRLRESAAFGDLISLTNQLKSAHRADEAVMMIRDWLATADIHATPPDDLCCLAQRFAFLGAPEDAITLFDQLISPERPSYQTWLTEKALAHFISGDFATGRAVWQQALGQPLIHDFLRQHAPADWVDIPKERYLDANTDVRGKSVRVLWDAAFGDAIQNLRYIHHLRREGATQVYMDILPPLTALVESSGFNVPNTFLQPLTETDCDYFALHQTLLLRYENGTSSRIAFPYIAPGQPSAEVQPALNTLRQAGGKIKVAVVWRSTNTEHRGEPYRSMQITDFLPLFRLPNISFFSCLHDKLNNEEGFYLKHHQVQHLGDHIKDLHDLACVFREVDAVVSVDSAPVHLAGAMAIPTYALIPVFSEWRWGRGNQGSFLYPSLRLFRQTRLNDWKMPIDLIAAHLFNLANQA